MVSAICAVSGKPFIISDKEAAYCRTAGIPLPKLHPHERIKLLLNFRNRTFLFDTTCAFSKKPILTSIPPERGYVVYDNDVWNSDEWEALDYGQDYDPNHNLFEQIDDLIKKVPLPNLTLVRSSLENSDYCNGAMNLKNCYLCFACAGDSDCILCWNTFDSKNVMDCISTFSSELCYNCRDIEHCYRVFYSESANYCSESYFLETCQSCKHCFGCVNLSNREYCWYNDQLTKEEYEQRLAAFPLGSNQAIEQEKQKFFEFKKTQPRKAVQGRNNENCSGSYIHNCKDCKNSFHGNGSMDIENCVGVNKSKDCFCTAFSTGGELLYNAQAGANNYNLQFCADCVQCKNLMYCLSCVQNTSDCFACVGLKKKQYCILNKQYSKEEYETLIAQIKNRLTEKNEWEEFFPARLSPMSYNCSDGAIVLPITKAEAVAKGFHWREEADPENFEAYNIPDDIKDTRDDILHGTMKCQLTGKKFRIPKQELDFYREMNAPIPRFAPLERVRMNASIFRMLEGKQTNCSHCHKAIESVYNPQERPIFCEECFTKTMY